MNNRIYAIFLSFLISFTISSCSDNKKQEPKEIDFLPKTTPYGIWTQNSEDNMSKLVKPMKDIEGATDDQKNPNDYIAIKEDLGFVAHDHQAFFIFDTTNMAIEKNTNSLGGMAFGNFADNHFSGKFYNFTKNIAPESVKITTPIDNYELIHKKSRFRFIYKNLEYKGSMLPATETNFYNIFAEKPSKTNCKIYSQANLNGESLNDIALFFSNTNNISAKYKSANFCELNLNLTSTYKNAGDIVEFSAVASLVACGANFKALEGNYSGIGFSLVKTTTNKLVLGLLGNNKPILLDCKFN